MNTLLLMMHFHHKCATDVRNRYRPTQGRFYDMSMHFLRDSVYRNFLRSREFIMLPAYFTKEGVR